MLAITSKARAIAIPCQTIFHFKRDLIVTYPTFFPQFLQMIGRLIPDFAVLVFIKEYKMDCHRYRSQAHIRGAQGHGILGTTSTYNHRQD